MRATRNRAPPVGIATGVILVLAALLTLTVIRPFGSSVTPPAGAPSTGRCPDQTASPDTVSVAQFARAVACLVNYERHKHGLRSLRLNTGLHNAAYGHAADMRSRDYFAHDSPGGSTPKSRAFRSHYLPGDGRWRVGEDLAWGRDGGGSARALVSAWMHSPIHRREILTRSYRDMGVGIARGSPRGADEPDEVTVDAAFGHR